MNQTIFGDCRETMRALASDGVRVQCVVTSPPYFGLRDYGHPGQIGLEKTPAEYVAALVEVFDCVRDLLADDGVLWVNLGDSYASTPPGNKTKGVSAKSGLHGVNGTSGAYRETLEAGHATKVDTSKIPGLKPKDLIGIPWRAAFALQEAGCYLRQDIIWHKPNPMPESVTDRCTKAHEYVFLLAKSARYFWDSEAMKEQAECDRMRGPALHPDTKSTNGNSGLARREIQETRNRRSVWTVATQPYSGAHFATFPPALIEPMIIAGSRPGDTVLDPFMGSGTVGQVAQALGRQWIGCELNPDYGPLQQQRTAQQALGF